MKMLFSLLLTSSIVFYGASVHAHPGSFNTTNWEVSGTADDYFAMFGRFLDQHNLIKMSRSRVEELLGTPDKPRAKRKILKDGFGSTSIYYNIPKSEKNYDFHAIRIRFANDEVISWCIVQNDEESTPYETDVHFVFQNSTPTMSNDGNVLIPMLKTPISNRMELGPGIEWRMRSRIIKRGEPGAPTANSLDLFLRGETNSYTGVDVRPWMPQRIFLDESPVRHEKKLP
jgi:hypothetical protein